MKGDSEPEHINSKRNGLWVDERGFSSILKMDREQHLDRRRSWRHEDILGDECLEPESKRRVLAVGGAINFEIVNSNNASAEAYEFDTQSKHKEWDIEDSNIHEPLSVITLSENPVCKTMKLSEQLLPKTNALQAGKATLCIDESNIDQIFSQVTLSDGAASNEKVLKKLTPGKTILQRRPFSDITNIIASSRERMKNLFRNDDTLRRSSISMFEGDISNSHASMASMSSSSEKRCAHGVSIKAIGLEEQNHVTSRGNQNKIYTTQGV
ncbi:hypothetical protein RIF29_15298 [Crotalaria pallida]|uniref:Uncharacterized protein n=1 Tax=Crotalaria pallida TaxID=3830 RepID=A0AAN9FD97_CROPI